MRRACCGLLVVGVAVAPVLAARPGRAGRNVMLARDTGPLLERRTGRDYDVITLRTDQDTVQLLVDASDRTTIRLNGHQYVLSSQVRQAWARGGWNGLGADDQARIRFMLDLANGPATLIEAMAAAGQGRVPDIDEIEWMYGPMAPGGCGIGGACSDEAWAAFLDFLSCTGSAGATAVTAFGLRPEAFFGGMLTFSNCARWSESQDAFGTCCGRHIIGDDGDDSDGDDPDDGEACDGCLPPDLVGPNPPCCYENP